MIQSHAENLKKILGALYQLTSTANSAIICSKGSQDFHHTFSMAFYHKWNVKNDFAYALKFFSLISDGLGGVG